MEIKNLSEETLSDKTFLLKEYKYDYKHSDQHKVEKHLREVYDHGDGASILLYNLVKKTVVLTRQFRLPSYLNGTPSGMVIEVCAGSLDGDTPEDCAKKEALEESGYQVEEIEKVGEIYPSPAVMTEIAYLFIAEYTDHMKVTEGGGLDEEGEYLEVIEIPFEDAFGMIADGQIRDARTVILLQHLKIKNIL